MKCAALNCICSTFLLLCAFLCSSHMQSASLLIQSASTCWVSGVLTLNAVNSLNADWSQETQTNRKPRSSSADLPLPAPPPICSRFIPCNRFSEGMLITTLHPPAPSPLQSQPSTCAFIPKSADGTAPCAWSCSAVSCQVSELDVVRMFAQNSNKESNTGNCVISLDCKCKCLF